MKKIYAKDIMVKNPIIIGSNEKIALADLIMARHNIGGLPVVDKGKLVGIITQRDIMIAKNYEIGGLYVRDLMTKAPITVSSRDALKKVLEVMIINKIERVPVVEKRELMGIISHGKLLKTIYDSL